MDIEMRIRTGNRRMLDSGDVKWDDHKDSRYLVTYSVDELNAVREALFQFERMLHNSLGLNCASNVAQWEENQK